MLMENDHNHQGTLIVSLDFELLWGLVDVTTPQGFMHKAVATREVIPKILELFEEFGIHATWATVGFLFFDQREELIESLPVGKPDYRNPKLSTYVYLAEVGADEAHDPLHFGLSLIRRIQSAAGQELGTHTFSHYYCLEPGQTAEAFQHDLAAARRIADQHHIPLESLVFPRNQVNESYLPLLPPAGITSYRGAAVGNRFSRMVMRFPGRVVRGFRLLDAFVNLSGENTFSLRAVTPSLPLNIPASRFLRPCTAFEPLRQRRIVSSLEFAAQNHLAYHLWWHPHNFAENSSENLLSLRKILVRFAELKERYGMESLNMGEVTRRLTSVPHPPPLPPVVISS